MQTEKLEILKGDTRVGDFVHQTQEMGTEAGFRNVSKLWLDKCLTYDQVAAKIEHAHSQIEDYRIPLKAIKPVFGTDENLTFGFSHEGATFKPTRYALSQIAGIAGVGMTTIEILAGYRKDINGNNRDRQQDREALVKVLNTGFSLIDPDKPFLVRTQKDGTLRGWLSGKYQIMDNHLLLNTIRDIIPSGVISHWRCDDDASTLFGNVLIPDTIRAEKDSEYGAMYSISNSEIGRRRLATTPSLFRAICMNGMIWDRKRGVGFTKVHRGLEIDPIALKAEMRKHLQAQIPLITNTVDDLLVTRTFGWDGATSLPIFAALADEFKLNKLTTTEILGAWRIQANDEDSFRDDEGLRRSAFAVINAVTRSSADTKDPEQWVERDELGGKLLEWKKDKWCGLFKSAKSMKKEEVHARYLASIH